MISIFHCHSLVYEFWIWFYKSLLVCFCTVFHFRYNALDVIVKSAGMNGVVKKMLIDQLAFVPCCQILFYSGNSILEVQ